MTTNTESDAKVHDSGKLPASSVAYALTGVWKDYNIDNVKKRINKILSEEGLFCGEPRKVGNKFGYNIHAEKVRSNFGTIVYHLPLEGEASFKIIQSRDSNVRLDDKYRSELEEKLNKMFI